MHAAMMRTAGRVGSHAVRKSNLLSHRRSQLRTCSALSYGYPIVSEPKSQHSATVIMLHGLGDTGDGWAAIGEEFKPQLEHVKFIFPTAPQRSITLNWGMKMTGWYDIASLEDINQDEDREGLMESKRYVEELVQAEVDAGIPSERIVVAGFSQGGATALMMLRSDLKLAGIIGLSSYLPLRQQQPVVSGTNKSTPLLMCHGDMDMTVQYQYGVASFTQLKEQEGMKAEFITYQGMAHSASPQELRDVVDFLKTHLP